jgi:hydroxymethylbilane synthase
MMTQRIYRIGTRGSDLALWQAQTVMGLFSKPAKLEIIKTEGDRRLDISLQGGSATGFFTKDIEKRLAASEIDVAVHSLKDLPTLIAPFFSLAAYLPRGPVGDLLLVHPDWWDEQGLLPVKSGCTIGAGSLRRQSLVKHFRPDCNPTLIRGNVPTRVDKCRRGEYGAIVLARAGLERLQLDLAPLHVVELDLAYWLPAPGQGAVAVEVRQEDTGAMQAAAQLDHAPTRAAVELERKLLAGFEGGCHTAFGAYARPVDDGWKVTIGIDRGADGWGEFKISGQQADISQVGIELLPLFTRPQLPPRQDLWSPWQL